MAYPPHATSLVATRSNLTFEPLLWEVLDPRSYTARVSTIFQIIKDRPLYFVLRIKNTYQQTLKKPCAGGPAHLGSTLQGVRAGSRAEQHRSNDVCVFLRGLRKTSYLAQDVLLRLVGNAPHIQTVAPYLPHTYHLQPVTSQLASLSPLLYSASTPYKPREGLTRSAPQRNGSKSLRT